MPHGHRKVTWNPATASIAAVRQLIANSQDESNKVRDISSRIRQTCIADYA
jgi:hypothetical protein